MTIHAGQKAARLRRAATSPSSVATVNNSTTGNTSTSSFAPIHVPKDNLETSLLLASPIADADVLGVQPCPPVAPVQSTTLSLPLVQSRPSPGGICKKHHNHQHHSRHTKQRCNRHTSEQKQQLHSASCTSLQSLSGHFVFSGVDLPPSQSSESTNLDWNTFDVHNPASTSESHKHYQPTLVFVQHSYEKEPCDTSNTLQEDTSVVSNETSSTSKSKSSPRRFLPWFLTLSPSSTSQVVEESSGKSISNEEDTRVADSNAEDYKKSSKKKKKKKKKGKGKGTSQQTEEDETDEQDGNTDSAVRSEGSSRELSNLNSIGKGVHAKDAHFTTTNEGDVLTSSYQRECNGSSENDQTSQEETIRNSDLSLSQCEFEATSDALRASQDYTLEDHHIDHSQASSSCHPSSQEFQLAKSKRKRKAIQRRESQHQETERATMENERRGKGRLTPPQLKRELQKSMIGHCHNISKTETEISYHTAHLEDSSAALSLNSLDNNSGENMSADRCKDRLEDIGTENTIETNASSSLLLDGIFNQLDNSTVSSLTGLSSASTDGERRSSQSSPSLDLRARGEVKDLDQLESPHWPQDKPDSYFSSQIETLAELEQQPVHVANATSPDLGLRSSAILDDDDGEKSETRAETLERHRRTLNWRLISTGSSSPTSQQPLQEDVFLPAPQLSVHIPIPQHSLSRRASQQSDLSVPSPSRSQLALQLRRHQQRRLNYAWVHLLPSFEDEHPRSSPERFTQFRRLSWLGLEDYIARKVKSSTIDGAAEGYLWVSHFHCDRDARTNRAKISQSERFFSSASPWLRSGTSRTQDAVHVYRSKVLKQTAASLYPKSPAIAAGLSQDGHQLEWLSSPPSVVLHQYPIPAFPAMNDFPVQVDTVKCTNRKPSDIKREESLELQRSIELSMYQMRCANVSIGADVAWLDNLSSIGQEEKNAIEAFFHDYTPDWLVSTESHTSNVEANYLAPVPDGAWSYPTEMAWPTTPYTPLGLTLGTTNEQSNEVDIMSSNYALSSGEMAEIEDAMYRDYLQQANQTGHHRSKKRERNHHGQGKGGHDLSQGMRSRASSAFSRTPSLGDHQGRPRFQASPMRTRSQEGRQLSTIRNRLPEIETECMSDSNTMDRNDTSFIMQQVPTNHNEQDDAFQGKEELLFPQCPEDQERVRKSQTREENHLTIADDNKHQGEHDVHENWAKNRIVRNSLADLQQHLCLVAAQKQTQGSSSKDNNASPPSENAATYKATNEPKHKQQSLPMPPHLSVQLQRGYTGWPLPNDPRTAMNTAALQSQHSLQTELKRQQVAQEARQLEQRHLDSHAQAMARSSSLSYPQHLNNAAFNDKQSTEVARLQAVLLSEWARYGASDTTYSDGSRPEMKSHFASPLFNPPSITLTTPAPVGKPTYDRRPDDQFQQRAAWSDGPILSLEEALLQNAQGPWQATIAQTADTQPIRRSSWNHTLQINPSSEGNLNLRRQSVQSAPSHTSEFYLPLNHCNDATSSAFSLRPEVFTPTKLRRPHHHHSSGSKRRGKQREGSTQSQFEPMIQVPPARFPLIPLNGDQNRQIRGQELQQKIQQEESSALANQTVVHPLLHSYDEETYRRNSTTNSRQSGPGSHRKQRRW